MKTEILKQIIFDNRQILAVPYGNEDNKDYALTAIRNLLDYGYTIDEAGINLLMTASKDDITNWYLDTVKKINEVTGNRHKYKPFYPNFPNEVMKMSDAEIFLNQIIHYITGYLPEGEDEKSNIKSLEEHKVNVLKSVKDDKKEMTDIANECFINRLKSKQTPSSKEMDKLINPFINNDEYWTRKATNVENRQLLSYLYTKAIKENKSTDNMPKLVTNDYLRIAKYFTELKIFYNLNNLSLNDSRITNIPRYMRKFIAEGLNKQTNLEEDIARNKTEWKILFKYMHVGEYPEYENIYNISKKLRNNERLETYYGRVDKAFKEKNYDSIFALYSSRPGEFIKNFNRLIHMDIPDEQIDDFSSKLKKTMECTFDKVKPEDLFNFMEYIKGQTRDNKLNVHKVNSTYIKTEKKYECLDKNFADNVINLAKKSLVKQISSNKNYGKVFISEDLKKMIVPKDIENSSNSLNSYSAGSRLPLEKDDNGKGKNIRAFIWWTNTEKERIDLDLSASLYRKKDINDGLHKKVTDVYFRNQNRDYGCVMSGDITDGGNFGGSGVCEFIDINLEELKKNNIDYVQLYVNSYTGTPFEKIPCESGWQEREELDKTKQFNIKAVKQHSNLTGNYNGLVIAILDVNNEEIIWIDKPDMHAHCFSDVSYVSDFDLLMDRYANGDRMNLYDLAQLITTENGSEIVDSPEKADTVFVVNSYENRNEEQRVVTSKDTDIWLGEFMTKQEDIKKDINLEKEINIEEKSPKKTIISELGEKLNYSDDFER